MRTIAICLSVLFFLAPKLVLADDAVHYFNMGLKGSVTRKNIEYFTMALKLNPKFADAYKKRGLLYYFQDKYDEMIQDYQTYLDLAPATAEAFRMLGVGYLKKGFYEPAIDSFTRAIDIEPKSTSAHAYRAETYRLMDKDDEAIRDSTTAIELRGDLRSKADAYRTRARVYRKLARMQLAVEDTRSAVRVDPRIPRFWRYYLNYASPEEMRSIAPFFIIALALVLIFGLKLKPPNRDD